MRIYRSTIAMKLLLSIALMSGSGYVRAGIEVPVRVVFHGTTQDMTLTLRNRGATPSLVQIWLDQGDPDAKPDAIQVPFLLTPSLLRIDPDSNQHLRIVALADATQLPQDRETRYYLNLLDIPPKQALTSDTDKPLLTLAVHHRMPFLYRPAALDPDIYTGDRLLKAATQVRWSLVERDSHWFLEAENPTPYSLSLRRLSIGPSGRDLLVGGSELPPMTNVTYSLSAIPAETPMEAWIVHYIIANDAGYSVAGRAPLN